MKKLTDNRIKFCEEYIKNGYNATQAYIVAYDTDNKSVASVEGSKLLKDPRIQEELDHVESSFRIVGYKVGITKEEIMKRIARMLDATKKEKDGSEIPDNIAINNAINTYAKLTGDFTERKQIKIDDSKDDSDIDLSKTTPEQRAELREQLLKDL